MRRNGKPGLVSFIGNGFGVKADANQVQVYFDRSKSNIIPMIKSAGHMAELEGLVARYFHGPREVHLALGNDPKIVQRRKDEEAALGIVQAKPSVQFLLKRFGGTIIDCRILEQPQED